MLFTAAKVTHLALLPQGQPERDARGRSPWSPRWTRAASASCTNLGECEAVCPKDIPLDFIARLNRDVLRATLTPRREPLAVREAPAVSHQD